MLSKISPPQSDKPFQVDSVTRFQYEILIILMTDNLLYVEGVIKESL